MEKPLRNLKSQKEFRQQLRTNSTSAESVFWLLIKGRQLAGRKFRRQYGVGEYILDFYCPEEKLAVELDGQSHEDFIVRQKDFERDEALREVGIRVLRFENKMIFNNQESVLAEIISQFGNENSGASDKIC